MRGPGLAYEHGHQWLGEPPELQRIHQRLGGARTTACQECKVGATPSDFKPVRADSEPPVLCISTDASIFALRDGEWQVEFSAQ